MKILILVFSFCFIITNSYSQTSSQDSAFNERIKKFTTSDTEVNNSYSASNFGIALYLQYNDGFYAKKILAEDDIFIKQQIYQEIKSEMFVSNNTLFKLSSGEIQRNKIYIFDFSMAFPTFEKSLLLKSDDMDTDPNKEMRLTTMTGNFRIGYGWTSSDVLGLTFFTGRGFGGSLNAFKKNTIDFTSGSILDKFDVGAQISLSKKWKINAVRSYTMFHNNLSLALLTNNAINIGGAYLIDTYLTDYLIKNKVPFIPIIQTIYQSAFNFLLYSMRKDNLMSPLPNNSKDVFGIPNEEFSIGIVMY